MKLTFLFLLTGLIAVSASTYSQNTRLDIKVKDNSIIDLFREIEEKSEFYFFYQKEELAELKNISVNKKSAKVTEILDEALKGTTLEYKIVDRYIIIRKDRKGLEDVESITSQQNSISGTVTDKQGLPLPGVTVLIKGTNNGTVTNMDGKYSITNLPDGATLQFSFVGMLSQEIEVGSQTTLNITMAVDAIGIEEVVAIGYGTQRKQDITGSVALIGAEEIADRPNTQIGALIQGKAAGVQVLSTSGKPSQGFSIRIRGTNSINAGSEPLYVVDGVPTNDTRSINPADVESVTVLKDASSAAIYGAQGANGVVLITTKKGTSATPTVSLNMYAGFSQVWNTLPVLNGEQYRDLMTEMGQTTNWERYNHNTDWQQEIFQNGTSQNYQVSLSGKSDKTNYYVSAGWVEQQGAVRSSMMERTNFKINIDQEVNDWLSMGSRIAYTKYIDVDVNDNSSINSGGVLTGAINTPSVIGVFNEDGTFTSNPFQNWENPVASTDGSDREYNSNRLLANMYVKINPIKDLEFKSNLGIDHSNGMYDYFLDPFRTSYGRALKGRAINSTDKTSYYIFENTLNYKKVFDDHKLKFLVGAVAQKFLWENNSIETRNFASDGITTVNGGSEINSATATKSEKSNSSFLSRINYDYKGKYLVTANFRADGSSIFGPDERWGYFPSFSVGWRVLEESFMDGFEKLSNLKIRVGWGIVGNDQISNYAYLGRVGSGANYPFGGVAMPGTYPSTIENRSLKWEESTQTNIGIDFGMFNSRIRLVVDAYIKSTKDLLLNAPLPRSSGYDNAVQNIGELENKGLEFALSTVNIDKTINWTTDFNISFNKNKVVNIVGQEMYAGDIAGRGNASLVREGFPLGILYGYVYGGIDQTTGNAYYIDQNGESTFAPTPDDRKIIGDANPTFFYGFTNTISYKGLNLMLFLEGSQGNDMLNATRIDAEGMTDPKNQSTAVLRRWRNPGDNTDIPKSSWGNTDNSRISTRFIEDGSYLRIKTITLSYQLPSSVISKLKLNQVKLYATGENLITFTNYSGFDPEVNTFGGSNTARGIDYGTYPQTRNIIFGMNITF